MSGIAVLGSINMDLVTQVKSFPRPGETVLAQGFARFPGGKGANQAVACGRLGAPVFMYGLVGDGTFAADLLTSLQENQVRTEAIQCRAQVPSGVATILVDERGENLIAVAPGANGLLDQSYLDTVIAQISSADLLLLQLEITLQATDRLLEALPPSRKRPLVILDPAPAAELCEIYAQRIAIITPNESELASLTGMKLSSESDIEQAANLLRQETGIETVICKCGARGAYLSLAETFRHFPGYQVQAIDTTAAGDAFNGGLAVALVQGKPLTEAIPYANAVAALSVARPGAQASMPTRSQVASFITEQGVPI